MRVIAISGKAESGKDTIAQELKNILEENNKKVMIIHFADVLKFSCQKYFGWNGEKNTQGRTLLQYVGTELREKNNPNMWVNITKELIYGFGSEFDYVIIPDVRFKEEMRMVKDEFNCFSLRIERYDYDESGTPHKHINKLTEEQRVHKSETELDLYNFDFVIRNNTTLDEAYNKRLLNLQCKIILDRIEVYYSESV